MASADFSFIVGILGNVISILVFTSPIGTFRRIARKKSTESFKGIPYIATLLSTSLWTFYGLLKPGGLLIVTVNAVGATMQAVYVALFLIYAPGHTRVKMMKLVGLLNGAFFGAVVGAALLAIHGSARLLVVGFLCAVLTVGMYASPLVAMKTVVKTKSVEYVPFFLSLFLFLNAGVWSLYSLLVKDYFIGVPNGIGFALGGAQLGLYAMYRGRTLPPPPRATSSVRMNGDEEEEAEGSSKAWDASRLQKHLGKVSSLPAKSSSVLRQLSFQRIVRSASMTPHELHSVVVRSPKDDDARNSEELISQH